jgi:hypothetical protein
MNKRLNIIFILTLSTAIITAGLYVYFYNTLAGNKQEANNFYTESKASQAKLKNLDNIEQNLKKTIVDGDKISALFVRQDSIVDLIQNIENLMKDTGVTGSVDSVSEDTTIELDALGKEKLNMVITANGKWSGMVNLLGLLEKLPYKSTINSFSLINTKTEETVVAGKKTGGIREWQLKTGMVVWAIKNAKDTNVPDNNEVNN